MIRTPGIPQNLCRYYPHAPGHEDMVYTDHIMGKPGKIRVILKSILYFLCPKGCSYPPSSGRKSVRVLFFKDMKSPAVGSIVQIAAKDRRFRRGGDQTFDVFRLGILLTVEYDLIFCGKINFSFSNPAFYPPHTRCSGQPISDGSSRYGFSFLSHSIPP